MDFLEVEVLQSMTESEVFEYGTDLCRHAEKLLSLPVGTLDYSDFSEVADQYNLRLPFEVVDTLRTVEEVWVEKYSEL